jgi:O-antigen/teichoic acid export membrane protein
MPEIIGENDRDSPSMISAVKPSQGNRLPGRVVGWLLRYRASSRLAFALRMATMGLNVPLSLLWTRWLLHTMGTPLNGLFLYFQSIAQLGGAGDFGIGGAVAARTMRYLARKEDEPCQRFLASARSAFLIISLLFFLASLVFSPWLPRLFGLSELPGSGSLTLLFVVGGAGVALLIICGYLQNLNYAYGNVAWPILPAFLFTQLGFGGQWLLAAHGAPLWLQYGVGVVLSAVSCVLAWWMLRISHPWLGDLAPLRLDYAEIRRLIATSFWVYLIVLGNLIYMNTDRILIGAGFGPEFIPAYRNNYKFCELAAVLIGNASYFGLPAIMQRLLGDDTAQRAHGLRGVERLQKFQICSACMAAVGYLFFNDAFIRLWLGSDFLVPLSWQIAFALNLAITIGSDLGLQILVRFDHAATRTAGITIGSAALLNLALSWVSMRAGSILGIAVATVVAQTLASVVNSRYTCARLGLDWRLWLLKTWLLPVMVVAAAAGSRMLISPDNLPHFLELAGICLALGLALARRAGFTKEMFMAELKRMRLMGS